MKRYLHRLAELLVRRVSANGTKSYSVAGVRFLTAADVTRLFPECVRYRGRAEMHRIPELEPGRTVFVLEGVTGTGAEMFPGYELRRDAPSTVRLEAAPGREIHAGAGCVLIRDKKLGTLFICPELTASRKVASAFRSPGRETLDSCTLISSWNSWGFGDFGLLMLPKMARISGVPDNAPLMLRQQPPSVVQYLSLLGLDFLRMPAVDKRLRPVRGFAEVVFGPGAHDGFVPLQHDIDKLRESFPKAIYCRRGGRRKIVNEEELLPLMRQLGLTVVEDDHQDMLAQAALFHEASFIVAPHGALLANLMYCRPGTVFIELLPGAYASNCYRNLSQIVGIHYHAIVCTTLADYRDNAVSEDFRVDAKAVTHAVKTILDRTTREPGREIE